MSESEPVDWHRLPADPNPDDLGYEPLDLDITESTADGGHYVILPHDEEFLREEAFIVADADSVVSLDDRI
ncbi:MAG: hypothetical protein ABEJ31_15785 [Haloarculaceae archaeon]